MSLPLTSNWARLLLLTTLCILSDIPHDTSTPHCLVSKLKLKECVCVCACVYGVNQLGSKLPDAQITSFLHTYQQGSLAQSLSHVQFFATPLTVAPPGSSVHGISQARLLEWVAISYSRGSSQPRDQTRDSWVSYTGRQILYHCATWEAPTNKACCCC